MSITEYIRAKLGRLLLTATDGHLMAIILLASFGVYFNSLFNGFVYDDTIQVLENHWIRDTRFIPDIFTAGVGGFKSVYMHSNYYRPMMNLVYMLNYHLFGLNPWGFHLINILAHSAVSVLVFVIVKRLISFHPGFAGRPSSVDRSRSSVDTEGGDHQSGSERDRFVRMASFIAAMLFAAHPIHTEAVTWVAGFPDLFYTLFCLMSLCFYIWSEDRMNGTFWASVFCFCIAVLCKEPAVMLLFILMAYDIAFRRSLSFRHPDFSARARRIFIPRYIPYLAVSVIYVGLRYYVLGGFSPAKPQTNLSAYGYIINVFPLLAEYLEKLVLPLNLNAFHVFNPISSLFELRGIVSLTVAALFILSVLVAGRNKGAPLFGLLVIALPLLPALYIPAVGENVFAERYLYFPSFGLVLLAAFLIVWIEAFKPEFVGHILIAVIAITGIFVCTTAIRNMDWRDNYSLWSDTVRKSADGPLPHNNLGAALADQGRFDEAIREYLIALRLKPENVEAHINIAGAYLNVGSVDDAIGHYQTAIMLRPLSSESYNGLGVAYAQKNMVGPAIETYSKALAVDPYNVEAYCNRGNAYDQSGDYVRALADYDRAIELRPEYAPAYFDRGVVYNKTGNMTRAQADFRRACGMGLKEACGQRGQF